MAVRLVVCYILLLANLSETLALPRLPAKMVETTRKVVVIGGGIIGTSTAYFLKLRGVDVTILEASSIAAGASGKAGTFVIPTILKYSESISPFQVAS